MTESGRDWLVTALVLAVVAVLVVVGWDRRERVQPADRGSAAPDFAAPTLAGDTLRLGELRGQVVLLNFWATWCPPCLREMPSMERLYQEWKDEGLEIVAVSLDAAPGERDELGVPGGDVARFVAEHGLSFPILLDPAGESRRVYDIVGLPTTFLIDRSGMIREKVLGGREWDEGEAAAQVGRLIRGDP